jgi:hypothetical protein
MSAMRTTVDIPDELFRRAKSEAALRGRKLKDLVEEGLWLVLEKEKLAEAAGTKSPVKPRSKSLHDVMKKWCGIIKDGPEDLASNPKYLDDYGR